ncbi:MAG: class I SAM-dependent methyltransferase [Candidatus Binataceae bacterium]
MSKDEITIQSTYFNNVQYRDPFHPVVEAYAAPKIDFIRRHVRLEGRILDVGSGNGIFAARFAQTGALVVGIDSSYPLLQQNPHRRLICADATRLPFPDASFDLVFEANVLHHVPDRELVVREMNRVCRRHIVLVEPNLYNPLMLVFFLLVRAERGGLKSRVGRLQRELKNSGLRVIASHTTGMISQNNTPERLLPWLRRFDRPIWWGEYIVMIAEKNAKS